MKHGGARKGAGRPKGHGKYGEVTAAIRVPKSALTAVKTLIDTKSWRLPLYSSKVSAGFPSPADDYLENMNLTDFLIKDATATFLVRASGNSMINAGIFDNDILIVDRSLKPIHGKIVIAAIDGQLTVKRLQKNKNGTLHLIPDNPDYQPIEMKEGNELHIWGVVTYVIHST